MNPLTVLLETDGSNVPVEVIERPEHRVVLINIVNLGAVAEASCEFAFVL